MCDFLSLFCPSFWNDIRLVFNLIFYMFECLHLNCLCSTFSINHMSIRMICNLFVCTLFSVWFLVWVFKKCFKTFFVLWYTRYHWTPVCMNCISNIHIHIHEHEIFQRYVYSVTEVSTVVVDDALWPIPATNRKYTISKLWYLAHWRLFRMLNPRFICCRRCSFANPK